MTLPHLGASRRILPLQGRMGAPNLPLTISVFTPLTLGRHPAAGRLPFGALAPEVGWVWQLPRYGGRNERAQVLARGGCCAGP